MSEEASQPVSGVAETTWFSEDILQTRWSGLVDGDLMRRTLVAMERELAAKPVRFWYCDTTGVTNYSVDIRKPSTALLGLVKAKGCSEIVSVVASAPIRMLSMSLSFVVGLKVKLVATPAEAVEYLKQAQRN